MQDPAAAAIHFLMTLTTPSHCQGRIHVNVMAGEIQTDQTLEDDCPSWEGRCQEDKETARGAAVRHHVENGAKCGSLIVSSRCHAICGIQDAGETV